jgi:hypothetical protein
MSNKVNLTLLVGNGMSRPMAFDDVILACHDLFNQCGFEASIRINSLVSDAINIVWGVGLPGVQAYETLGRIFESKAIFIFNMEQIGSQSPLVSSKYLNFITKYRLIDYNIKNITKLAAIFPQIAAFEFPLIPSKRFIRNDLVSTKTRFDACFYGNLNKRRLEILESLAVKGVKVDIFQGLYGEKLSERLVHSKFVLNIHNYCGSQIFESPRCIRPVALCRPVISEESERPKSIDWCDLGVSFADLNSILTSCLDDKIDMAMNWERQMPLAEAVIKDCFLNA